LEFQEFVILVAEVEKAERQLTCVARISDMPEQNTFPVETPDINIFQY
jgi:hypothetical protein